MLEYINDVKDVRNFIIDAANKEGLGLKPNSDAGYLDKQKDRMYSLQKHPKIAHATSDFNDAVSKVLSVLRRTTTTGENNKL